MQYINPYELLNVENNIPQNKLVKPEDKQASKADLAREIVEKYIANGITDLKDILHECAKKAGLKDADELPIGPKHLIERVFRNYNQNKAAGINSATITKAQNKIKISDCNPDIISTIIRKQKAALFREIELNQEDNGIGSVEFRGMQLTKADCRKSIDDLDDMDKKDFHLFIYQNKMLNDFLTHGELTFFYNYKVESIYNFPAFIDFISPFYSEQYNKTLGEYFEKWNTTASSKILSISPLVNNKFIDGCYSNVHLFLRSITNDIKKQQEDIEEDNELLDSISVSINPPLINLLPTIHFQNIRNSIGNSIKCLAVVINNKGLDKSDDEAIKWFKVSFQLIKTAKEIECTGLDEMRIRDNYFILKNNFDNVAERLEKERANRIQTAASERPNLIRFKEKYKTNQVLSVDTLKLQQEVQSKIHHVRHKKGNYKPIIIAGLILFIAYLFSLDNSSSSSNEYKNNSYSNNNYSQPTEPSTNSEPIKDVNSTSNNSSSNSHNDYPASPIYVKEAMMTGNFPQCSGIKPKYDYNLKTRIIISAQSSDIALKLIDKKTDRCIRFIFLNEGETYTVNNIPEGLYYLKIAYGNGWAVKEGEPTCKGHFTSNVSYKKDTDIYNFYIRTSEDGSTSTPYYKLRLYTVYTKGTDYSNTQNSISEDDFNS